MSGHIASSGNVSWNTRPDHLSPVRAVFGGTIDLDPCWNPYSTTDPTYICWLGNNEDGLHLSWTPARTVFVNPSFGTCFYDAPTDRVMTPEQFNGSPDKGIPPYAGSDRSRFLKSTVGNWIRKCALEAGMLPDREIILLVPAAVDTQHWQQIIFPTSQALCFIEGRVRFYRGCIEGGPAPMACAFVYWGRNRGTFKREFSRIGHVP